jgi:hypothetical protein
MEETIKHDFSKALIRCSSLGAILTEPQSATDKAAGNLSKTAKTALINTYIKEVYDREKDIETKQMKKGTNGEGNGIINLGRYLNKHLEKNLTQYQNEWIKGTPDIIDVNHVYDTKLSWDLWSFLPNVLEPLDKGYYAQIQGYMWLTGLTSGSIAYILEDCPQDIIDQEKYYLLKRMNVISEESPEYIEAAAGLEINLIYPDIDLKEKVLIINVDRDDEIIEKIKGKVAKCREFLQEFSEKHKNFNKILTLA